MVYKGRFIHKALLAILICSITLFLNNCGGGDDGGPVIPPMQDLYGTYYLIAFTIVYSDGFTLTQDDVYVDGTMAICEGTITQSFRFGDTYYGITGTYTVTYTNGTSEGYFTITNGTGTHDVPFWISGYDITTYSGVVPVGDGVTYEEWDTWEKVDNSC